MPITHDPETGWGFTFGNQPYVGFATRDAAAEALYDLERGREPPETPTPNRYDTGELNLAWLDVKTPIATLASGIVAMGSYDTDGSRHCVSFETDDGHFYADRDGLISGEWAGQQFEMDAAECAALCALFASGVLPQLLAIAAAWDDRIPRRYDTDAAELVIADWIVKQVEEQAE